MPFSVQQFLEVFRRYNEAIWPMQILFYLLGVALVILAVRGSARGGKVVGFSLSFFWIWMGVLYQFVFFRPINPAAALFALLFVLQAVLLALSTVRNQLQFGAPSGVRLFAGYALVGYAMVVYPALGLLFGHVYPQAPLFGAAPCPTVIFTLGLLLWTRRPVPRYLLVIPGIWALIGFFAAVNLHVYEDFGLLAAGLIAVPLVLHGRMKVGRRSTESEFGTAG